MEDFAALLGVKEGTGRLTPETVVWDVEPGVGIEDNLRDFDQQSISLFAGARA